MPTENQTQEIIARVQQLLAQAHAHGVHLELSGSKFDDEWLYLTLTPTKPGERASQHAHLMTSIERALRAEGFEQVLLVPAVPEFAG